MPVVRKAITRLFGRFPNASVHPDQAIALGAAMQAGLIARAGGLEEIRITDVCPYTLGVDHALRDGMGGLQHGLFSPIIERNTPVPVSRVHRYQTIGDNQRKLEFNIYQGEARLVRDNVEIGRTTIDMPRGPAGQSLDVRFSYDVSGLLEVDILVHKSGATKQLVIQDNVGGDDKTIEQSRKMLESLKVHPRDQEENRAAMARAERCYEHFLGDQRGYVEHLIGEFQGALATQDPRAADVGRKRLHEALDRLEGETFL